MTGYSINDRVLYSSYSFFNDGNGLIKMSKKKLSLEREKRDSSWNNFNTIIKHRISMSMRK